MNEYLLFIILLYSKETRRLRPHFPADAMEGLYK